MSDTAVVVVDGVDLDTDERAELARMLRAELLQLDVDSVEPVPGGRLPPGAKAGDAVTFGALAISFGPEVFRQIVSVMMGWLGRQRSGVKIAIDGQVFEGEVSRQQLDAFVAAYLARVTPPGT